MSDLQPQTLGITYGSPEFWMLYDEFCQPENLRKLVNGSKFHVLEQIHHINRVAHRNKVIDSLTRPDHGWEHIMCWLTLQTEMILNRDGEHGVVMRAGDVIVVEHAWDRDVVITHAPIDTNTVSGYFLSGTWEPMIGLFLPLFHRETILRCIDLRLERNILEAKELAQKEAEDWEWYPNA